MRYRKKPVVVEAQRVPTGFDDLAALRELAHWCGGEVRRTHSVGGHDRNSIFIETLEGTMRAMPGDYIIKGVHGEFYPCRGDIFEETYEPVES
jgi:hypothetical protein